MDPRICRLETAGSIVLCQKLNVVADAINPSTGGERDRQISGSLMRPGMNKQRDLV